MIKLTHDYNEGKRFWKWIDLFFQVCQVTHYLFKFFFKHAIWLFLAHFLLTVLCRLPVNEIVKYSLSFHIGDYEAITAVAIKRHQDQLTSLTKSGDG